MLLVALVYLSSLLLPSSALFRAASVGGAGGDPFDDIVQMGLQDAEHDFRVLNLLLWGEDDQAVPAFEASYIVLDGGYQGTQWPAKHDIYSHPEGHPRYYVTLESGDVIEWMHGYAATDSNLTGGLFLLKSLTFSIRRANGSLEEFTVGKRVGQPVSIMGPVAGFWGGIAGAFDQLGVYIDPTMWPARPTRLIKYPLHGRLRSRSTDWSYFDDAEALGYPMVTRIVSITVVLSADSIHGIGITYEQPLNGSLVYIEHGNVEEVNATTTRISLEMGDYVEEMAVEVGAEEVTDIPDCLQFLQLTIFKSATDHKQLYSFGKQRLATSTTSGRIVVLHGIKDSTCIQRLGGHVVAESSLFDNACPLPPAPTNGYLVNTPLRVSVKSSVVFACNEGFELTQGGYLTCREDGFWDGETPVCSQRSVTNSSPSKQDQNIAGYAALGSIVGLLCAALGLVLVCAAVTCLNLVRTRKRISKFSYSEQVHYVREGHDGGGGGGELHEPNNEASQDTYHHEEKMAMGADLFESDKSNLY